MGINRKDDLKRLKTLPVTEEFITLLLENPQNYYVKSGIPEGTNYVKMYYEHARDCAYIVFQNDSWEPVGEGAKIPEMNVEVREIHCKRCKSEMMYDEDNNVQYCPRCERRFA